MKAFLAIVMLCALALRADAQTIATFNFSKVGSIEVELFDDKPITVSNFIKYVTSGRYENQLIHRWVPDFVIQGGGFRVDTSDPEQYQIIRVPIFGTITNEAHVGTFRSNTYGTIAMARVGGQTNSATSQWFINLKDNGGPPAELDEVDNGFTVFGRMISGTNILNKFVPPPPVNGIYIDQTILGSPMATLTNTANLTYDTLVYVDISLRRDMNLQSIINIRGNRQITWDSVAGVTHALDYSTNLVNWTELTTVVGTGQTMQHTDPSDDPHRFYRVRLVY